MHCYVRYDGLGSGAHQVDRDAAGLMACKADSAAALRFYRTTPTVSIGAFDTPALAARQGYCVAHGIPVVRRLTGGGAVYVDPGQLGWTLVTRLGSALPARGISELMEYFTTAVTQALQNLKVPAYYRYPNDIEVVGRKLASCFIAIRGDMLIYQGTVLLAVDTEVMLRSLLTPTEKLTVDGIRSARDRLIALNEIDGSLGSSGALPKAIARALVRAIHHRPVPCPDPNRWGGRISVTNAERHFSPRWEADGGALRAWIRTKGGVVHVALVVDSARKRIRSARFAGVVHLRGVNGLARLSAALQGTHILDVDAEVRRFFDAADWDAIGVGLEDVLRLLRLAVERVAQQRKFGLNVVQANTLMVHPSGTHTAADKIIQDASVMLVPYCAKPPRCKWRNDDGCTECGGCEVGDAYRLARERGMRVVSINNFEHLGEVLKSMRESGVHAYVGMCCSHFYQKRQRAFDEAGIAAVLMDISGSNCYELQQEDAAYAGAFMAKSRLNVEVMEKVVRNVNVPTDVSRRCV
ncbi:MAG: lipoyl protein ligase domain-containing protein [Gammaproteobacteria bacterium]